MWTLYVISIITSGADAQELKFTKYNTYDSAFECDITQVVLEPTFTQDEYTMCIQELSS